MNEERKKIVLNNNTSRYCVNYPLNELEIL